MRRTADDFFLAQPEPKKSCFLALRDIILQMDDEISGSLKYGMPCFSYRKKAFCYLWADKKTGMPYLLMVEGKHLHHPRLESGSRARMKVLYVDPEQDLEIDLIREILAVGLDLYRKGIIRS